LEGGWPSTTIFTPGRERLFGFSGVRPVEFMIANLKGAVEHVGRNGGSSGVSYDYEKKEGRAISEGELENMINFYSYNLLQSYDSVYGGFGQGQKFPQGRALDYALDLYEETGDQRFLDLVKNTLRNQYTKIGELETNYNLFDPVEGGFHRYGTQRDWTPPHFEKMLYDNARLLKAYSKLERIDSGEIVSVVVRKTREYVEREWYDWERGGFWGNTDVAGEDEYYGRVDREEEGARVEETKYSNWNAEMILTYLYLFAEGDDGIEMIVKKSLDFFAEEMVGEEGVYHYMKDGEKGVRGSLLDNSYMLLAFVEGQYVLKEERYLVTAQKIADYSLENLYDWHGGGFFERNSPDKEMYALGEEVDFGKPSEENGIMAYGMLKLYLITGEWKYLNAGMKTLGAMGSGTGGLDRGYYFVKSAELILEEGLLEDYENKKGEIEKLEKGERENFWVDELVGDGERGRSKITGFVVSEEGLDKIEGPILILIIIALFAGLLSFISPCTLPILPAYLAGILGVKGKNVFGMALAFFVGLVAIFTFLGIGASLIGGFLRDNLVIFSQVAGGVMILFGVMVLFGRGFGGIRIRDGGEYRKGGYFGAMLFGGIMGISWTPCVGPILVGILILASTTGSAASGGMMLFAYGVGLAVPLLVLSGFVGKLNKEGRIWKILKGKELRFKIGKEFKIHSSSLISGVLFIVLGWLIFSGTLTSFNQYLAGTGLQKWVFGAEEWLLGWVK